MMGTAVLSFAGFRIDAANGRLWRGTEAVSVPPKVLSVLHHLAKRPQELVTKADLFSHVWPETAVGDAVLTVAIGEIRKLLGDDPRTPRFIETVHRRGYRFIAPVRHDAVGASPEAPRQEAPAVATSGCEWIVGRDAELSELDAILARTLAGERQMVFLTGAPGLGKTTLVDAFLEQVAARGGVRIAKGQCVEHYGSGEAYLPMFEALGTLAQEIPLDEFVPLLRRCAPSWLAQMPKLLGEDDFLTLLRTTAGVGPERRLREMLDALEELAARTPLVLVLEDLHWSDHCTIDLLAALARRRGPVRLLVVGTYRAAEVVASGHPLAPVTQELLARRQGREVALHMLEPAAVRAYLAERFPDNDFPDELSALLQERTDGNPLFMVQVVEEWLAGGRIAPDVLPVPLEITQVTVATGLVLDTISWSVPPSQYGLPPDGFLVWWSDGILADPLDGGAKLSASSRRFSMAWPSERDHSYAVAAYRHTWQGEQAGSKQQHETWRVVT